MIIKTLKKPNVRGKGHVNHVLSLGLFVRKTAFPVYIILLIIDYHLIMHKLIVYKMKKHLIIFSIEQGVICVVWSSKIEKLPSSPG